jgi:hypothetical protein
MRFWLGFFRSTNGMALRVTEWPAARAEAAINPVLLVAIARMGVST